MCFAGVLIAGVVATIAFPFVATATVVTVDFSGEVLPAAFLIPPELAGSLSPGDAVAGRFRYDTDRADQNPDPQIGQYVYTDPQFSLEVTLGQAHLATDPASPWLWIQILDGAPLGIAPEGLDVF